ncbi:MAG TPA: DUF4166 domain-containing protein [Vicinamibacterales bacterium]|nr:DUF4166 domain-containing protein [Vicinamibacterales bacterium]
MGLVVPAATGSSPYETILGDAFASLPAHVRRAHLAPLRAEGAMDVDHGRGLLTQPIIWLMHLPGPGPRQSVRLDVAEDGSELVWTRQIGSSILRTRQRASGSRLVETLGRGSISFDLSVDDGALLYRHSAMRVAGVRIPSMLSPHVAAAVSGTATGWHVEVTITWRDRMVCRYAGDMQAS